MQWQPAVLPWYLRRESSLIVVIWGTIALVALLQALVLARVAEGIDLTIAVLNRVSIVPLWALATPLILRSARKWPVLRTNPATLWPFHLAAHLAFGSLFIGITNIAIQLPLLPLGIPLFTSAVRDIAENYPPAIVVYLFVVALGHLRPTTQAEPANDSLTIRQWNRVHLVRLDDIDWIAAEDNYVVVYAAGRSYKGRERISDIASRLDPRRFVRIHRSTIVQVAKIREVQPLAHGDHAVILRDGTQLRASRNRRRDLSEALAIHL